MGLPSCVIGHTDIRHDCQVPVRIKGSKTVRLYGISWSRMGDMNSPHIYGSDCDKAHAMPIAKGSKSVYINGVGAGRITDKVAGCTMVAQGWGNILTG